MNTFTVSFALPILRKSLFREGEVNDYLDAHD